VEASPVGQAHAQKVNQYYPSSETTKNLLAGRKMRKSTAIFLSVIILFAVKAQGAGTAPLKLVATYEFPGDVKTRFDHVLAELHGRRLFTTPQSTKSVMVFSLKSHKLIHTISGTEIPHHMLYREDLDRLYVTDGGGDGELKIFDGKTYDLIKSVKLLPDTDASVYDPATKYLYIVNGGKDIQMPYSMVSIVDTTSGEKVGEMKVDSPGLDGMAIETSGPKLYVSSPATTQIVVIDRNTRTIIANWPITLGKTDVTLALDESHHRLFVGCRSGQIVVFDTETGKELQALPINQGIDDLVYDPKSKRLYAACPAGDGSIDVYKETDPDHYESLGKVPTGPGARTGELVPELKRYFVAVPQHESTNAKVLEYKVQ
jgi:DNA-binding beta-propeller fold protein YncE